MLWRRVLNVPERLFYFGRFHGLLSTTNNQSIRLLYLVQPFNVCAARFGRVRMQLFDKPSNRVRSGRSRVGRKANIKVHKYGVVRTT
jgi:hypothetical protein